MDVVNVEVPVRVYFKCKVVSDLRQSKFDQKKKVVATRDKVNISMNFSALEKGRYDLIVDVVDLYTKVSQSDSLKIDIL